MTLNEELDAAFERFLSNKVSDELLRSIKDAVTSADVDTLLKKVESLDDPSAYCKDDLDEATPSGFFLFIDFISALIINLGSQAAAEARKFGDRNHPLLPWIIKYTNDDRFHDEIMSKFDAVFTE